MASLHDSSDPHRTQPQDDLRDPDRIDNAMQPDPELVEGPASGSRVALYAVAVVVLLGAVFYGLNGGAMNPNDSATRAASQSSPATQDTAPKAPAPTNNIADNNSKPPVAPGVRDVTPSSANSEAGSTTGSAPARPQAPQSGPTGTEVDRAKGSATQ